ncbi:transmembrane inner ear expressed protein [Bradysia coprophila]|uniref:transmembrane inner ear expressed protein n=1 Tax=Bradysia coprophila TaxID=38358 RepID=UPI00187DB074|nr:transmembrane inner ear expressed protein [Bradysia coprophila]
MDGIIEEPEWLEKDTGLWDLKVWHLIFICFSGVASVTIMLCCCIRFRIPRTKQEIEADFQRRKIAKKFREHLACIKNSEMDDMDLQKALERIRQDFLSDTQQAINNIEMRSSMENITNKKDQHSKLGAGV